jgi:ketosteroid isomerase-like protein
LLAIYEPAVQSARRVKVAPNLDAQGLPNAAHSYRVEASDPDETRDLCRRLGVVNSVVAPDAIYVSLNTDNADLNKIMPWAGTSHGPQAFLDNLGSMFTRWENQAFNVTTIFASGENVAVFGEFRYRSKSLGKVVSSPFSILAKVVEGKVT